MDLHFDRISVKKQGKSMENLVKRACEVLGLTQKELAQKLNVSKSIVEKWSRDGAPSESGIVTINLLLENHELKRLISGDELERLRAEAKERGEKLESLNKKLEAVKGIEELEQERLLLREKLDKIAKLAKH